MYKKWIPVLFFSCILLNSQAQATQLLSCSPHCSLQDIINTIYKIGQHISTTIDNGPSSTSPHWSQINKNLANINQATRDILLNNSTTDIKKSVEDIASTSKTGSKNAQLSQLDFAIDTNKDNRKLNLQSVLSTFSFCPIEAYQGIGPAQCQQTPQAHNLQNSQQFLKILSASIEIPPDLDYALLKEDKHLTRKQIKDRQHCIEVSGAKNLKQQRRALILLKYAALTTIQHLILERTPLQDIISNNQQTDNTTNDYAIAQLQTASKQLPQALRQASPLAIESYLLQHRMKDPQWHNNIKTASSNTLLRKILEILAENQAESFRLRLDIQRLITLEAISMLNNIDTKKAENALKAMRSQMKLALTQDICGITPDHGLSHSTQNTTSAVQADSASSQPSL